MVSKPKRKNNFIIIICVLMLAVLTFINRHFNTAAAQAQALFEDPQQLSKLQLPNWQAQRLPQWHCNQQPQCHEKIEAWLSMMVREIESLPLLEGEAVEVEMTVVDIDQTIKWRLYPKQALLISPNHRVYKIISPKVEQLL
ncbi:hypothetical protein [Paraferrimonas sp. SM1919]|uniref:hypothetical protein n=1 Tax=Paraferrimonas sp. SM1919 TaxID=2662263 RepID=UPI0013D33174|nr:hypothetical protein [Paraferrimonas sp. SM1919]